MPHNVLALAKFYLPFTYHLMHFGMDTICSNNVLVSYIIGVLIKGIIRKGKKNFYQIDFGQQGWRCPWQMVFWFHYFWITLTSWYRKWSLPWNPRGCNRTAHKWKAYFLNYLHVTSLPVHHVRSCGCRRTQKNQVQVKTKVSSTAMKAERNAFTLPTGI